MVWALDNAELVANAPRTDHAHTDGRCANYSNPTEKERSS